MVVKIQLRHDTAANWTNNDPTLAAGEFGCETDTGKIKIGDGSNSWNSLSYSTGDNTISGLTDVVTNMTPSDGDVLTWDDTQSMWSSQTPVAGGGISGWQSFSAGTGIGGFTGTYAISGDSSLTVSVDGYTTISSNAKDSYNWINASSQRYEDLLSSGNKYTQSYNWFNNSSSTISDIIISGDKYSKAYASAQIALYSETYSNESDLIEVLNDNYHPSGYVISGEQYSKAYASAQIALYSETYSSEDDLISILNDNYAGSGAFQTHKNDSDIHFPSSNIRSWLDTIYAATGAVGSFAITGASDIDWNSDTFDNSGIKWDKGSQKWIPTPSSAGSDSSAILSIASGLTSTVTIRHDGIAGTLSLVDIPQNILKSGSYYWKGYLSGQVALYSETYSTENDLTAALNDNYPGSSNVNISLINSISSNLDTKIDSKQDSLDGSEYYPSSLGKGISSNVKTLSDWFSASSQKYTAAYASAQIALYTETYSSEGDLTAILDDNYHPSGFVISGQEYSKAYASTQIALYSETYSSEGDLTSVLDDNYHPSGYVISGQKYSQAYASAQVAMYEISDGIDSWDSDTFLNSGILWNGSNWVAMPSGGSGGEGAGQWNTRTGGIYYANEVTVGHANFDVGPYQFQVSGDSYFSGSVTFIGEISGIADPTYASGVSNKHYIDTISSNLDAKIDAVSDTPSNWGTLTEGTGIASITGVGVSGSGDHDVTVLGYSTISSNAVAGSWASSNMYTQTWIDSLSGNIDSRLEDLEDNDEFDHTLYSLSSNLYNQTWIDTLSGSIDTRLEALESQEPSSWSGAADYYGFSSNISDDITSLFNTSSAHDTRLDTLEGEAGIEDISWTALTAGLGISTTGDGKISGSLTIDVDDYIASSVAINKFYYQESDLTSVLNDNYAGSSNINRALVNSISSNLDSRIDTLEGYDEFDHTLYITSSNSISRFSPSTETRTGWANVADGGTFAHNCSAKPSYVNLTPSGANPIAYSFTVDASDVTVYHTSDESEDFSWMARV